MARRRTSSLPRAAAAENAAEAPGSLEVFLPPGTGGPAFGLPAAEPPCPPAPVRDPRPAVVAAMVLGESADETAPPPDGRLEIEVQWADGQPIRDVLHVPGLHRIDHADLILAAHLVGLARRLKELVRHPDAVTATEIGRDGSDVAATVTLSLPQPAGKRSFQIVLRHARTIDEARARAAAAVTAFADETIARYEDGLHDRLARHDDCLGGMIPHLGAFAEPILRRHLS